MNDLVAELWAQALREGVGVTGVGERMAQLVAEECVKVVEADEYAYVENRVAAIRRRFNLSLDR